MGAENRLVQPSLWGEPDRLEAPALGDVGALVVRNTLTSRGAWRRSTPACERSVVVSCVGHNIRVEAPEAYLALLQDFLESL